jgi:hypothetical protein
MAAPDDRDPSIVSVLRDLDALRKRLDQAPTWFRNSDTSVAVAARAEEIRRLCQRVAMCKDLDAAQIFISDAKHRLTDLERLLGLH